MKGVPLEKIPPFIISSEAQLEMYFVKWFNSIEDVEINLNIEENGEFFKGLA